MGLNPCDDAEIFRVILERIESLERKIAKQKKDLDVWIENYGEDPGDNWDHARSRDRYRVLCYELNYYYKSLEERGVQVNTIKQVLALRKAENCVAFAHYWKLTNYIKGEPALEEESD